MSQLVDKNSKYRLFTFAFVLFTIAIGLTTGASAIAQEQSDYTNLKGLLEALRSRIESEASFQVTFKFAQPLMDNNEIFWHIPYYSEEDDIDRWIGDIGDDFICFYERAGSASVVRCTPFSNISSITYLES
jgi:hypothetical protein